MVIVEELAIIELHPCVAIDEGSLPPILKDPIRFREHERQSYVVWLRRGSLARESEEGLYKAESFIFGR
ncbi:hypothetical protein D3C87_1530910 [compost metagenome]